jgi:Helix-turn-helix domain
MQTVPLTPDLDAALDENEAAILLGLSARTLQAWRVRGCGPRFMKIGRAVRYQRRELIAFQQANTFSSTTEADATQILVTAGTGDT